MSQCRGPTFSGAWRSQPPRGRAGHAAALVGDRLFVFGGHLGENKCSDELLSYNFADGRWSTHVTSGNGPCDRDGHSMCAHGTNIYVFGGETSGVNEEYLADLHRLDTLTMTWSCILPEDPLLAPCARRGHSTCAVGDSMFLFGGHTTTGDRRNDLHQFDFNTQTWTLLQSNLPHVTSGGSNRCPARSGHSCIVVDDTTLVIFGGCHQGPHNRLNDVWLYNIAAGIWSRPICTYDPPRQCSEHAAVLIGRQMIVNGGWVSETHVPTKSTMALDVDNFTWREVELETHGFCPPDVADHCALSRKGVMWVCGGYRDIEQPAEGLVMYTLQLRELQEEPETPQPPPRLQTDLLGVLKSSKHADVELVLADGEKMQAHRVILSARSEYFRAVFDNMEMRDAGGSVALPTITREVAEVVLRFIYGGASCDVPSNMLLQVLAAADMLLLDDLKVHCEMRLAEQVSVDNCCVFLECADKHGCPTLRGHCIRFAVEQYELVVDSEAYAHLAVSAPALHLEICRALKPRLRVSRVGARANQRKRPRSPYAILV